MFAALTVESAQGKLRAHMFGHAFFTIFLFEIFLVPCLGNALHHLTLGSLRLPEPGCGFFHARRAGHHPHACNLAPCFGHALGVSSNIQTGKNLPFFNAVALAHIHGIHPCWKFGRNGIDHAVQHGPGACYAASLNPPPTPGCQKNEHPYGQQTQKLAPVLFQRGLWHLQINRFRHDLSCGVGAVS